MEYREGRKNQRVHGISFEKASEVFDDPNHLVGDNYFIESDGEQRLQVIGMTRGLILFVDRSQHETQVIHVISARKAVDYEESIYNDQFR